MKTVSPITDLDDVKAIYRRFIKWDKHREAELVIFSCNVALRISDILQLKFNDINLVEINNKTIGVIELEEKKTRKHKKLTINQSAMDSIARLKEINPSGIYLFEGVGNRTKGIPKPISRQYVSTQLIAVKESLGLTYRLNTHSFRKTFGYHAYKRGTDINVLQKLFNHSSVSETFKYIGITDERVREVYLNIEIGL
ncbi:tyrosine-type recombinase/integrase [Photobacterium carnosum]|uniref:tyrosine-type recombinase/integrase n=1 Tax=Photobacterium carnosum TaxID=2023717 RepID=UPI001E387231|nr:tyrosine-type recombinase/integrase [Photobacterium carnosum]MCD9517128.1 tyrosine-type recombinase/integrase [Photobacterium carnosum]